MKTVIQRVRSASVRVDGTVVAAIGHGMLILAGFDPDDTGTVLRAVAQKIASLRIFGDREGKMNLSCPEAGGAVLCVPEFTLSADIYGGRRPSFSSAMEPRRAAQCYRDFLGVLAGTGLTVEQGEIGRAHV